MPRVQNDNLYEISATLRMIIRVE